MTMKGNNVKLCNVPRDTHIKLSDAPEIEFNFKHIDGMYSYCTNDAGDVVHLAAWTDVEPIEGEKK